MKSVVREFRIFCVLKIIEFLQFTFIVSYCSNIFQRTNVNRNDFDECFMTK